MDNDNRIHLDLSFLTFEELEELVRVLVNFELLENGDEPIDLPTQEPDLLFSDRLRDIGRSRKEREKYDCSPDACRQYDNPPQQDDNVFAIHTYVKGDGRSNKADRRRQKALRRQQKSS